MSHVILSWWKCWTLLYVLRPLWKSDDDYLYDFEWRGQESIMFYDIYFDMIWMTCMSWYEDTTNVNSFMKDAFNKCYGKCFNWSWRRPCSFTKTVWSLCHTLETEFANVRRSCHGRRMTILFFLCIVVYCYVYHIMAKPQQHLSMQLT